MLFQIPSNAPSNLKVQVFDARLKMPVNQNYSWDKLAGRRQLSDLTTIVCHHDALAKSTTKQYGDIELAQRIAISHINSKKNKPLGDAGMPYHVWIRSGVIYIVNDPESFTYGVVNNNAHTIHICVSGNYAGVDSLDERDRNALYAAIEVVKSLVPSVHDVKGHKEITSTACPGYDMTTVRNDVKSIEATMALGTELDNTQSTAMAQVYAAYTRFTALYNTAKVAGPNQSEAQRKIGQIASMMVETGILKAQ